MIFVGGLSFYTTKLIVKFAAPYSTSNFLFNTSHRLLSKLSSSLSQVQKTGKHLNFPTFVTHILVVWGTGSRLRFLCVLFLVLWLFIMCLCQISCIILVDLFMVSWIGVWYLWLYMVFMKCSLLNCIKINITYIICQIYPYIAVFTTNWIWKVSL